MLSAALDPTQLPVRWVTRGSLRGVKRQGSEADHLPPSSAEVNNGQEHSLPLYVFMVSRLNAQAEG
jgi:hypothetical protein